MNENTIYRICARDDWEAARTAGAYAGSDLDRRDGFIHCSTAEQLRGTLDRHFAGQDGLVLLEIDAAALGADLRWEPSRGGAVFPHLYAALPVSTVVATYDLPLDATGRHSLPEAVFGPL